MMISLRAGAKIYLNGAVIKVDRKVNLELMNDATFLLDTHVLQAAEATTPLKQLYFVLQTMLMDPVGAPFVVSMFETMLVSTNAAFENQEVLKGLETIGAKVAAKRTYEAMKLLRSLFPIEEAILFRATPKPTAQVRAA